MAGYLNNVLGGGNGISAFTSPPMNPAVMAIIQRLLAGAQPGMTAQPQGIGGAPVTGAAPMTAPIAPAMDGPIGAGGGPAAPTLSPGAMPSGGGAAQMPPQAQQGAGSGGLLAMLQANPQLKQALLQRLMQMRGGGAQ